MIPPALCPAPDRGDDAGPEREPVGDLLWGVLLLGRLTDLRSDADQTLPDPCPEPSHLSVATESNQKKLLPAERNSLDGTVPRTAPEVIVYN